MSAETMENQTAEKGKRGIPKLREGRVVSSKMSKTVVVEVSALKSHRRYGKFVRETKRYFAHDERNECGVGDRVLIREVRPLSKLKRWRVQTIVEKAA